MQSICALCQSDVITSLVRRSVVESDLAAWPALLITSFNVVLNFFGVTCYKDTVLSYEGFSFHT